MSTPELQLVTKYPPHTFCWIDLSSTDPEGSKQFYSQLMGWTYEDVPVGDGSIYTMFHFHGHVVAGCGPMQPEQRAQGMPSYWSSYISVTDAEATTEAARQAGATILAPPFDVMEEGRMAIIQDPTGAVFGLWEPRRHIGAVLVNIPGAWVWNEVMTRDIDAVVAFYTTVFGWTASTSPDEANPYCMFNNGDRAAAGVFVLRPEMSHVPPNWTVYLNVADHDAAVEKVAALGGAVLGGPIETDAGRIAVVQDPQGAMFHLIQATYVDPPPQG